MPSMRNAEVKLSDIFPNPFRRLDLYPLDEAKITHLAGSIERTTFWDNVVGRPKNGHYELAYGHHRIEAARRKLGQSATIRLIVRDLDDATMLKMMAADNDDAYNLAPGFILETVQAAKVFVCKAKNLRPGTEISRQGEAPKIAKFLAWPTARIEDALAQLAAINRKELSQEAVESLPTQKAAKALHRAVKEAKKKGTPIPKREQVAIARRVAEQHEESAPQAIQREVLEHSHPSRTDAKVKRLEDFVGDTARLLHKVSANLEKILELKAEIHSEIYRKTLEVNYLMASSRAVIKQLKQLLNEEDDLEQPKEGNNPTNDSSNLHRGD